LGASLLNEQEYRKLITFPEFDWLKRNKNVLFAAKIERDLGMPQSTLSKALKSRGLPINWHEPLKEWVNQFLAD
jgi:hypothetical protein